MSTLMTEENTTFSPETSETEDESIGAALDSIPKLREVWSAMEERPTFPSFVRMVGEQMSHLDDDLVDDQVADAHWTPEQVIAEDPPASAE